MGKLSNILIETKRLVEGQQYYTIAISNVMVDQALELKREDDPTVQRDISNFFLDYSIKSTGKPYLWTKQDATKFAAMLTDFLKRATEHSSKAQFFRYSANKERDENVDWERFIDDFSAKWGDYTMMGQHDSTATWYEIWYRMRGYADQIKPVLARTDLFEFPPFQTEDRNRGDYPKGAWVLVKRDIVYGRKGLYAFKIKGSDKQYDKTAVFLDTTKPVYRIKKGKDGKYIYVQVDFQYGKNPRTFYLKHPDLTPFHWLVSRHQTIDKMIGDQDLQMSLGELNDVEFY